jgi:sugar phosphate permease
VASEEQGLAGGLLNTSFQFGGALVLAIVTAVINANVGSGGTPQATLDGFHAGLYVSVFAAVLGIVAMSRRSRAAEVVPAFEEIEESLAEAAEAA